MSKRGLLQLLIRSSLFIYFYFLSKLKKPAMLLQLVNKGVKGDIKAITALLPHMLFADAKKKKHTKLWKVCIVMTWLLSKDIYKHSGEITVIKEVFNAILRISFKSFVEKVFLEVSPNSKYLDNWHINVICSELDDILHGKNHRLIVNIPPRYMKSIICSVAYPAYILGINPKATIIAVSYNDELSQKLALDCKRVMESHWYQELFPRTKISKSRRSISDFETTLGGGRFSTSVNGTLTGRGADFLIIDDPIKPDDANSETVRTKTNEWYGSTLYSRLNNKNTGNVIVIMQRLHDEDFTGYLLNTDSTFRHYHR